MRSSCSFQSEIEPIDIAFVNGAQMRRLALRMMLSRINIQVGWLAGFPKRPTRFESDQIFVIRADEDRRANLVRVLRS